MLVKVEVFFLQSDVDGCLPIMVFHRHIRAMCSEKIHHLIPVLLDRINKRRISIRILDLRADAPVQQVGRNVKPRCPVAIPNNIRQCVSMQSVIRRMDAIDVCTSREQRLHKVQSSAIPECQHKIIEALSVKRIISMHICPCIQQQRDDL